MSIMPKMEYALVRNTSSEPVSFFRHSPVFGILSYSIAPGQIAKVDTGSLEERPACDLLSRGALVYVDPLDLPPTAE